MHPKMPKHTKSCHSIKGKVRMGFDHILGNLHGKLQCDNGERQKTGHSLKDTPASPQLLNYKQQVIKEKFWTYSGHKLVITIIPLAT